MFEKLDEIDWASMNHAYGSAGDVPQLLRDLASDDDDVRDHAFHEAYGNIFHQGTRYEATAPTVPFLLEILEQDAYSDKDRLMYLMAHLVMGYGEYYLPFGFRHEIASWRYQLAELRARPDEERDQDDGDALGWGTDEDWLSWIVNITDETRRGVARYIRLLGDDEEEVRIAAGYLLSWLPEDYDLFAPSLWQLVAEDPSHTVRANALLGLAIAADDEAFAEYRDEVAALLRDGEPIVQFAAAIALGTRCFEDAPDAVVQVLLDTIARAGSDDEGEHVDWLIPWYEGEPGAYAADVLAVVARDQPERVVRAVGDSLAGMHSLQAANAASTMVAMLFPGGFEGEVPNDLEPLQREFLEVLAEVRNPWFLGDASFVNFTLMMGDFGLPSSMDDLRTFLASGAGEEE